MARFTKVPETTFEKLQINAGIILSDFNPASPPTSEEMLANILCATTGGNTFNATPTFADYGEDIDNMPKNMKELKRLQSWEIKLSGTALTVDAASAKRMIGAADVDGIKITPRADLLETDFSDIWLVADYGDKNGETKGGFVAIHMMSALSTGGFQLKTADKAKGQYPFEYTAHYTMQNQSQIPFEVYIQAGEDEDEA